MRKPHISISTLILLASLVLALPGTSYAQEPVEPEPVNNIFECWTDNGDGTYTAFFGYENPNAFAVEVPYGPDNYMAGGGLTEQELEAATPTQFGVPDAISDWPGRSDFWPNAAFSVVFDGSNLDWNLQGSTETASIDPGMQCRYHISIDKEWLGNTPYLPDDFVITAASELNTVTCGYEGNELVCDNNNDLEVPAGTTYAVEESEVPGWMPNSGVGTGLTAEEDATCDGQFCTHTVVSEPTAGIIIVHKMLDLPDEIVLPVPPIQCPCSLDENGLCPCMPDPPWPDFPVIPIPDFDEPCVPLDDPEDPCLPLPDDGFPFLPLPNPELPEFPWDEIPWDELPWEGGPPDDTPPGDEPLDDWEPGWDFTINGEAFNLPLLGGTTSFVLEPGQYTIEESYLPPFEPSVVCLKDGEVVGSGRKSAVVDVDLGEVVECLFTNSFIVPEFGFLRVEKVVEGQPPPEGDDWLFLLTMPMEDDWYFFVAGALDNEGQVVPPLPFLYVPVMVGEYTIREAPKLGYVSTASCTSEGKPVGEAQDYSVVFDVEPGQMVNCTFHSVHEMPTAITLPASSIVAEDEAGLVNLTWQTVTEPDNAGFNVYRAGSQDGPWTQINEALIAAQGDASSGADYSFVDAPGYGIFYYQLEAVNYYGATSSHGPVMVDLGSAIRAPRFRPSLPEF